METENTLTTILTAFSGVVSSTAIYNVFSTIMPFVGSLVLVVLGITVLRRVVKGASKLRLRF